MSLHSALYVESLIHMFNAFHYIPAEPRLFSDWITNFLYIFQMWSLCHDILINEWDGESHWRECIVEPSVIKIFECYQRPVHEIRVKQRMSGWNHRTEICCFAWKHLFLSLKHYVSTCIPCMLFETVPVWGFANIIRPGNPCFYRVLQKFVHREWKLRELYKWCYSAICC